MTSVHINGLAINSRDFLLLGISLLLFSFVKGYMKTSQNTSFSLLFCSIKDALRLSFVYGRSCQLTGSVSKLSGQSGAKYSCYCQHISINSLPFFFSYMNLSIWSYDMYLHKLSSSRYSHRNGKR